MPKNTFHNDNIVFRLRRHFTAVCRVTRGKEGKAQRVVAGVRQP